jgi:hypothetical protein
VPRAAPRVQFLCYKKLKKVLKSLPALNPAELEAPTTSGEHPTPPSTNTARPRAACVAGP